MRRSLLIATLLLAQAVFAQDKPASDVPPPEPPPPTGKTNLDKLLSGRLSISLLWGAAFSTGATPNEIAPIYLGATASYWLVNRFVIDLHSSYSFNTRRINVLLGPRVRSWTQPIAASIGVQAGVIVDPIVGVRFGLTPIVALDMIFGEHLITALEGCVDVPIPATSAVLRVGLNLGWRF